MSSRVAVVIPCYRVKRQVLDVLSRIGPEVDRIYVVDDACPEATGLWVLEHASDPRLSVLTHAINQGVGAAVMTGYGAALAGGADIMVKVDGDGQMDPALIPRLIAPIVKGQADYTKGNRFFDLRHIRNMPAVRLLGNAVLSFMAKLSTGYWHIFDPTNGFTAIHAKVASCLDFEQLSKRYFFESDLLFRLNTLRAVVVDIPMHASYGNETSGLQVRNVLIEFLFKNGRNLFKRIFYSYFLRDMTIASLELVCGMALMLFGLVFGSVHWVHGALTGTATPLGTIMLAALPTMLGLQMLLAFVAFDIANIPRRPIYLDL